VRAIELLNDIDCVRIEGSLELAVTGVTRDSRNAGPGDVFCAVPGYVHDGHDYALAARRNGAALIVLEREVEGLDPPYVIVEDARRALALIAHAVYGHPSRRLFVTGITGTNGKTTTSYLADAVLGRRFERTAVIGTLGIASKGDLKKSLLTTPESVDLAREMRSMADRGVGAVTMEVSSHSLALRRVDGIAFDIGVFTNISRDHLDFHKDFDDYLDVKLRLFEGLAGSGKDSTGVINADDARADEFRKVTSVRTLTYSLKDPGADVYVERYYLSTEGSSIIFRTKEAGERCECIISLLGRFNVVNAASAFAVGLAAGVGPADIVRGLESVKKLSGRFEKIEGPGFEVFVDFAHTPDALENLLITARELAPRRIILVFGCGGNRDKSKRPIMGEIGARLADLLIITSDNPRMENPEKILDDIEAGAREVRDDIRRITSRPDAIDEAVRLAEEGDMVLVAGKGHEDYQIIGTKRRPFDDRIEILKALRHRAGEE
jgi:UDP-N-acetylmuramoyl-L-alanyl-D-glutamate--2,6-diaminopimelate ligase